MEQVCHTMAASRLWFCRACLSFKAYSSSFGIFRQPTLLSSREGGHFSIFLNDCNTSRVYQDTSMHTCNFSIQKGFVGKIKLHSNLESSLHYIVRLSQTAKQTESTLHHFCFVIDFSLNFLYFSHKIITVSKEPSYPLGWGLRSPF